MTETTICDAQPERTTDYARWRPVIQLLICIPIWYFATVFASGAWVVLVEIFWGRAADDYQWFLWSAVVFAGLAFAVTFPWLHANFGFRYFTFGRRRFTPLPNISLLARAEQENSEDYQANAFVVYTDGYFAFRNGWLSFSKKSIRRCTRLYTVPDKDERLLVYLVNAGPQGEELVAWFHGHEWFGDDAGLIVRDIAAKSGWRYQHLDISAAHPAAQHAAGFVRVQYGLHPVEDRPLRDGEEAQCSVLPEPAIIRKGNQYWSFRRPVLVQPVPKELDALDRWRAEWAS